MAVKNVRDQVITKTHALYNGDSCRVLEDAPDSSVGFSVFSPPFVTLYTFSDSVEDLSNNDYAGFFKQFGFIVDQLMRVLMPGRIVAVHCMDLPTYKRNGEEIGLKDFSGDIIRLFQGKGFSFHSRHCIWKDPLVAATRTKALGLAHKQLCKDSTLCRMGIPDYVLGFRKPGENFKPIAHPRGLAIYHGKRSIPHDLDRYLTDAFWNKDNPYNPGKDKRSHWIWQQYASPVWFDINQTKVLPYRAAKDEDDEKHICPLQLDVIERCLELWSAPGDVVLSPFAGIGSEIYVAVKNGRKGLGIELKPRYFRQMVRNLEHLQRKQGSGFREGKRGIAP